MNHEARGLEARKEARRSDAEPCRSQTRRFAAVSVTTRKRSTPPVQGACEKGSPSVRLTRDGLAFAQRPAKAAKLKQRETSEGPGRTRVSRTVLPSARTKKQPGRSTLYSSRTK